MSFSSFQKAVNIPKLKKKNPSFICKATFQKKVQAITKSMTNPKI